MRLCGDDHAGCVELCGAVLSLPPAPAPRNDQLALIGEDYFARLWVVNVALPQRGVALRAIREVDGDGTLQGACIEDSDGQGVTYADHIAQVDQHINAGD